MTALFIYKIPRPRHGYHTKRILFYRRACRLPMDDLLILYDSKYTPGFNLDEISTWAPRVRFLDYHTTVRRFVDFSKQDFLEPVLEKLRSFISTPYKSISHVYSYMFHNDPLTKMLMAVLSEEPRRRIVQLEDGLHDYLMHHDPELFPEIDPYAGSPFCETKYRHFFSNELDFLPRERFDYALFHPQLVYRSSSRQVSVFRDFQFIPMAGTPIRESTVIVPQTVRELRWLHGHVKKRPDTPRLFAALNPGGFGVTEKNQNRRTVTFLGDVPMREFMKEEIPCFSSMIPLEYQRFEACTLFSNHSSVLYRLPAIQPEIKPSALVPTDRFAPWYLTHGEPYEKSHLDAIALVLKNMNIPVSRAPFDEIAHMGGAA